MITSNSDLAGYPATGSGPYLAGYPATGSGTTLIMLLGAFIMPHSYPYQFALQSIWISLNLLSINNFTILLRILGVARGWEHLDPYMKQRIRNVAGSGDKLDQEGCH